MLGPEEVSGKTSSEIYALLEAEYADDTYAINYIRESKNDPYYETEELKHGAAMGIVIYAGLIF